MSDINFHTTCAESTIINQIADRAMKLETAREGDPFTKLDITMDIAATHCNGCRLRLQDLRDANDFDFAHDVLGIRRHLNRDTGKLADTFCPRFTQPE